jgi:hypothetical protein
MDQHTQSLTLPINQAIDLQLLLQKGNQSIIHAPDSATRRLHSIQAREIAAMQRSKACEWKRMIPEQKSTVMILELDCCCKRANNKLEGRGGEERR